MRADFLGTGLSWTPPYARPLRQGTALSLRAHNRLQRNRLAALTALAETAARLEVCAVLWNKVCNGISKGLSHPNAARAVRTKYSDPGTIPARPVCSLDETMRGNALTGVELRKKHDARAALMLRITYRWPPRPS